MEPEDTFTVKLPLTQGYWISNSGDLGYVSQSTITANKLDLSTISTRDLLNECYRRRAIEKFDASIAVDKYFLDSEPASRAHLKQDLITSLISSMLKNGKFTEQAIAVKESEDFAYMRKIFESEIYICKHPTQVKK